jgi:uncharacterized protein (TIGR03067 family)
MNDVDRLQGTWAVVELETDGQPVAPATLADARIVVSGSRFTSVGMGPTYEGTLVVDASAAPRRLELRFDGGPEHGGVNHGIYELDGDTWRICLGMGTGRPTAFSTAPGSGCALETLRRESADTTVPARSEPAPAAGGGPATELEGEWTMVSGTSDGSPLQRRMVTTGRRVTRGDLTTVLFGTWVYMRMRFTLLADRSPRAIDYVVVEGTGDGQLQRGIYGLDGDRLTLCVAPPGQERPADFSSRKGDGRLLTVWRRSGC